MTAGGVASLALTLSLIVMTPVPGTSLVHAGHSPPIVAWTRPGPTRGTPVSDNSTVYVETMAHQVAAIARETGHLRWTTGLAARAGVVTGGRLLLTRALVIAGADEVEAFQKTDGRPAWRAATPDGSGAGIYLGAAARGVVFAGSYTGQLFSIDLTSGHLRWAVPVGDAGTTTVFAPVWDDDQVVAGFSDFGPGGAGGVVAVDFAGRIRWRAVLGEPGEHGVVGAVVAAGGLLISAGRRGTIYALDRVSGRVRWSLPAVRQGPSSEDFRPVSVGGRRLFAGSLSGEVIAYDLVTRCEIWRAWPVQASVAFAVASHGDVVYVPYVSGVMVALDSGDGGERWRLGERDEGFRWLPLVEGPFIYLSGGRAGLVALRREEQRR